MRSSAVARPARFTRPGGGRLGGGSIRLAQYCSCVLRAQSADADTGGAT